MSGTAASPGCIPASICTSVGLPNSHGITGVLVDASAVRDTLGTGIYFMTYESSKQLLTTFGGDHTHSNPLAVLVAGGLCGIVSWAMICMELGLTTESWH